MYCMVCDKNSYQRVQRGLLFVGFNVYCVNVLGDQIIVARTLTETEKPACFTPRLSQPL
jgi:hypothetical protein